MLQVHPQPYTQPSTLKSQLNPTLNTQHSTLNTQHSTLNTQHSTLNTRHSMGSGVPSMESALQESASPPASQERDRASLAQPRAGRRVQDVAGSEFPAGHRPPPCYQGALEVDAPDGVARLPIVVRVPSANRREEAPRRCGAPSFFLITLQPRVQMSLK